MTFVVEKTDKSTLQPIIEQFVLSYIDEAVFRWNTRRMSASERFAHMFAMSIGVIKTWDDIKVGLMVA